MVPSAPGRFARSLALTITNLTKIAGMVVAVNEILLRSELRPLALATAGFMMAGAQLSQTAVLTVIDRIIGTPPPPPPPATDNAAP